MRFIKLLSTAALVIVSSLAQAEIKSFEVRFGENEMEGALAGTCQDGQTFC